MEDNLSETVTKETTSKGRLLERDRHTYKREQLKKGRRRKRATKKEDTKYREEGYNKANQGVKTSQF